MNISFKLTFPMTDWNYAVIESVAMGICFPPRIDTVIR